jgi:hypothetical protein
MFSECKMAKHQASLGEGVNTDEKLESLMPRRAVGSIRRPNEQDIFISYKTNEDPLVITRKMMPTTWELTKANHAKMGMSGAPKLKPAGGESLDV